MKFNKIILLILFTLLITFLPFSPSFAAGPDISAKAYFLMDNETEKKLYSHNENEKMYPASTTKILTAIIAIENTNLNDVVTASASSFSSIPSGYVTAEIQDGEQFTVEQLLDMVLVHSANDAANVLAEFTGGSIDNFINLMNKKVSELGLSNSHFTNAYGLHDPNHYTTAFDLAYIMKYCMKNETFKKFCSKDSCDIAATNLHGPRKYPSTNEMLIKENTNFYRIEIAGKTGFTTEAGGCLVAYAKENDLDYIGVVLGSDDRFADMKSLFESGYSDFSIKTFVYADMYATSIKVSNGTYNTCNLNLTVADNISTLLSNSIDVNTIEPTIYLNESILAPIKKGDVLGTIFYEINGASYSSNLIASHDVEESEFLLYAIYFGIILVIFIIGLEIYFYLKSLKKVANMD